MTGHATPAGRRRWWEKHIHPQPRDNSAGEPYAGKPHVRFGGRGGLTTRSYPYPGNRTSCTGINVAIPLILYTLYIRYFEYEMVLCTALMERLIWLRKVI